MKATSVLNFLTAVLFLLTAQVGWGAEYQNSNECNRECEGDPKYDSICDAGYDDYVVQQKGRTGTVESSIVWKENCKNQQATACKRRNQCDQYDSKKEIKAECTVALKDLKEATDKEAGACDEYEAAKGADNSCEGRVAACEKKISEIASLNNQAALAGGGLNPAGGTLNVLMQFYAQQNKIDPKAFSTVGGSTGATSCLTWTNDKADEKRKEMENKKERLDEKIKAAKQKIADLEKEMARDNEALRKETASLDEEKEKVQTTYKENVAKLDVKKREKYTALNKSIQESLVKIRNLNSAIIALKEKMEREKFEQSQRMVDFAEDKIDSQCKQAVNTAKGCFMGAAKGQKFPKGDPCEGFTATGKGITGTAVMTQRLNDVRNACFERANLAQDKLRYDYNTKIKMYEQEIMEKQNQIKDMNRNVELEKQEFDAITKENETEKANETASTDQKTANLAEKLNKLTATTNEKLEASKKQIEQLKMDVEELVAQKLPSSLGIIPDSNGNDIKVAHREAKKAIKAAEKARVDAFDACGCKESGNEKNTTCTKLKKGTSENDGGGIGGKKNRRSGR